MNKIRCKAVCTKVDQNKDTDGVVYQEVSEFAGVYSPDPKSENAWFAKATPFFVLQIGIDNSAAFGSFSVGQQYYVDISPAVTGDPAASVESPAGSCDSCQTEPPPVE
jgi:hypothetical protein